MARRTEETGCGRGAEDAAVHLGGARLAEIGRAVVKEGGQADCTVCAIAALAVRVRCCAAYAAGVGGDVVEALGAGHAHGCPSAGGTARRTQHTCTGPIKIVPRITGKTRGSSSNTSKARYSTGNTVPSTHKSITGTISTVIGIIAGETIGRTLKTKSPSSIVADHTFEAHGRRLTVQTVGAAAGTGCGIGHCGIWVVAHLALRAVGGIVAF